MFCLRRHLAEQSSVRTPVSVHARDGLCLLGTVPSHSAHGTVHGSMICVGIVDAKQDTPLILTQLGKSLETHGHGSFEIERF